MQYHTKSKIQTTDGVTLPNPTLVLEAAPEGSRVDDLLADLQDTATLTLESTSARLLLVRHRPVPLEHDDARLSDTASAGLVHGRSRSESESRRDPGRVDAGGLVDALGAGRGRDVVTEVGSGGGVVAGVWKRATVEDECGIVAVLVV